MEGNGFIPVRMRDCSCPGQPHAEGDFAYLKPRADIAVGLAAHSAIYNHRGDQEGLQIALGVAYTVHGIDHWDLQDEHGKPLPISAARTLPWSDIAELADRASVLYSDEVLAPLRVGASKSSPNGRTNGSTYPRKVSTPKRRKR